MPLLRNELVFDRHSTLSQRSALESLKREAIELELQIRQLQVGNNYNTCSPLPAYLPLSPAGLH